MPCGLHADGFVITSSAALTEKILPLDVDLIGRLYYSEVWGYEYCAQQDNHELLDNFLEGTIDVPFSAQDLLRICRENTTGIREGWEDYCKRKCTNFVKQYMKALVNNSAVKLDSDACVEINQFTPDVHFGEIYGNKTLREWGYDKFSDCLTKIDEKEVGDPAYDSPVAYCQRMVKAAKKCTSIMITMYTAKLKQSEGLFDGGKRKMYQCVIDRLQTGQIDFPFSRDNLEAECSK